MDQQKAYSHLKDNIISNGYRHRYYKDTKEIAKEAERFMSRDTIDQKKEITNYRIRESEELKSQRLRLTNTITSVALSPVYAYFEETKRADGIKMEVAEGSESTTTRVKELHAKYYGEKDLYGYIHKAILYYNKYDPNAWILQERKLSDDGNQVTELYPVEISSEQALDYAFDTTGVLQYLAFQSLRYAMIKGKEEKLTDYYIYSIGFAWYFAEVNADVENAPDYEGMGFELTVIQNKTYATRVYDNGTTEVPAIRAGAYLSGKHHKMIAEVPVADAYPILRDLQRDKSHMDVSKTLHVFPRLFEYVKACDNVEEESGLLCQRGYIGGVKSSDNLCKKCNGAGFIVHGSEQDVIRLLWPQSPEDVIALEKLSHYEELPFDIVNFLRTEIDAAQRQVFMAVFNQEMVDKTLTVQTATEIRIEYDKIYNKLQSFTEVKEVAWEKFTRVGHQYMGDTGAQAVMAHPYDFKLKNVSELTAEYAQAKDSGLPYLVLWSIQKDILKKQYRNTPSVVSDVEAFEQLKPWRSKSSEEVALIIAGRENTDLQKVLWENWDEIVSEVQASRDVGREFFRVERYSDRKKILYDAAQAFIEGVSYKSTTPETFGFGASDGGQNIGDAGAE